MLDIKYIKENPQNVKYAAEKKKSAVDIEYLLHLDTQRRQLQHSFDQKRALQKKISKEIPKLKKSGEDTGKIIAEMQSAAKQVKQINVQLSELNKKLDNILINIPNVPHPSVPDGIDERDNVIVKDTGEIPCPAFTPKEHHILGDELAILNSARGAKISGSGFPVYRGGGALLERALINFMLDYHRKHHHYEEVAVPCIVNRDAMTGTGQLPKLEDDMYRIEQDDLFLIPTAEVPLTNLYRQEILPNNILPQKLTAITPCFRREAGSYGKDTKGLQRIHQFNKVELVRFVTPGSSYEALEEMVTEAESILEALGLPYRRVLLCSGDMSFASSKTYDLEVWSPGVKKFLEVSSLSNFEDFQARRASIRYRDEKGKVNFVHTLNGSGLATPRTFIAIVENYQNEDGSIAVPEVLRKYLDGIEKIEK